MPSATAAFATSAPIAPRPMIPRVLPLISGPANWLLPFSTCFATDVSPSFRVAAHAIASGILREEMSRPVSTSSFTALALAPGVLNTGIPISVHLSMGMLLVPAPARAMASRLLGRATSCRSALRTRMPCASLASLLISNWLAGSFASPTGEMAFMVLMVYIMADNPL